MPASSLFSATTSGVAMSVDLQDDGVVHDGRRERLHRGEGWKSLRPAGAQVEEGTVARARGRAGGWIELALGERPVVVRAAVLDRVQGALAVEDADLAPVVLDQAHRAGRQLGGGADCDGCSGGVWQRNRGPRQLVLVET